MRKTKQCRETLHEAMELVKEVSEDFNDTSKGGIAQELLNCAALDLSLVCQMLALREKIETVADQISRTAQSPQS